MNVFDEGNHEKVPEFLSTRLDNQCYPYSRTPNTWGLPSATT